MTAIKSAGVRYVVMVAKHHDGFCLWPTNQSEYSVKSSSWKNGQGDVVGEVAAAARKHGLKLGIYLSPWDRHERRYANSAEYDNYYLAEMDELIQHYGELVEWWLDGAGGAGHVYNFSRYIEELRTYQPDTLVFADMALFDYGDIRWIGNEDGRIPYENWNVIDRHGFLRWRPAEADTPLRKGHWFWSANAEDTIKSVGELLAVYDNQHVEHYRIEIWNGKAWSVVVDGDAIGHKKIDSFQPTTASRIRLNILGSTREAHIREFQVFRRSKRPADVD